MPQHSATYAAVHPVTFDDQSESQVIAVDLDGTLVLTDTLHESVLAFLKEKFFLILLLPIWLLRGKAAFKSKLVDCVSLNAALLPYNRALIDWLIGQRASGKKIVLTTAADQRIANAVSQHIGLFDEALGSDGKTNNASENKSKLLDERFGPNNWDYVGNSKADLAVWKSANQAIVVNASQSVVKQAKQNGNVSFVIPATPVAFIDWLKVIRVHQWLKNLLLFIPLLAAHQIDNLEALWVLAVAFVASSFCASAVYIANDLLDLDSDRQHPRKRLRPFASGTVPIYIGSFLAPMLALLSLAMAWWVSHAFTLWLVGYFVATCAYTLWLKKLVLVDCLTLAGLYTLRIIAGAAAVYIALSFWLLAFSVFIFLSLAFVKRFAELQAQADAGSTKAHGRGYMVSDQSLIQTLGVTAGYAAVLVLALYLHSDSVLTLYAQPELIWLAVPLMLFWVSWIWLNAHRGQMHDDPIVFAIKDKASLSVAGLVLMSFVIASKGFANQ
jgi:4-hydroxybenzoate polyprenyltransferase/phosphoserine phosphatase